MMKKVEVLFDFYDKFHTSTHYKVGDVVEFDEERAADVIARGLAKAVKTKGKTEKTQETKTGNEGDNPNGETDNKGKANTDPKENEKPVEDEKPVDDGKPADDVKPAEDAEDEKKKASEKKAAEILAKVNKK